VSLNKQTLFRNQILSFSSFQTHVTAVLKVVSGIITGASQTLRFASEGDRKQEILFLQNSPCFLITMRSGNALDA
jgi:hypothetical protein